MIIHFNPYANNAEILYKQNGDRVEIEWMGKDLRFSEKLATPDVTIAD